MDIALRLYCHGLGDCSLVGVPREDGGTFWILIDCGLHSAAKGGRERIAAVVDDVRTVTGGRIDVVVGTHEHWDHLSAFHPAAGLFDGVQVGEVWFPWTEDPADPAANALDRFKGDAAMALADATLCLSGGQALGAAAERIDPVLGFVFGATGERVRDAREALRRMGPVRHLRPGARAPLPPELGVTAYVLGPPEDTTMFRIRDAAGETYRFGAAPDGPGVTSALFSGLAATDGRLTPEVDSLSPFDVAAGRPLGGALAATDMADFDLAFLSAHYAGPASIDPRWAGWKEAPTPDQAWRRIDSDWLGLAADLALQLDNRTNNTSLVLAFEIAVAGRVLLFAADAQIGSWRSWPDVVFAAAKDSPATTGADLMRRTVFLKVGHHGSRNATRSDGGLERMESPDLVAFIPTDELMARKVGWTDIPADKLLARLKEMTRGRLIASDAEWVRVGRVPLELTGGAIRGEVRVEAGPCVALRIG